MSRKTRKIKHFPIEHEDKEWTESEKYKKWVKKMSTSKKARRTPKEDLCAGEKGICKNDLGISRKHMPQFTARRPINKFRKYVKEKYNVDSWNAKMTAAELNPAQGEINRKKVKELIADGVTEDMRVPLVVSKNDYIVDGHHRWAAFRMAAPKKPMKVVVIGAPIKDVLGMAVDWGAETQTF